MKYMSLDEITVKNSSSKGSRRHCSNTLPFYIKVMHMSSAFGEVSDFVAIISVEGLQENEWHVEKVIGLSYTCQFRSVGYIYFAHTRAGTKSM